MARILNEFIITNRCSGNHLHPRHLLPHLAQWKICRDSVVAQKGYRNFGTGDYHAIMVDWNSVCSRAVNYQAFYDSVGFCAHYLFFHSNFRYTRFKSNRGRPVFSAVPGCLDYCVAERVLVQRFFSTGKIYIV